jgi:hypothetical protein
LLYTATTDIATRRIHKAKQEDIFPYQTTMNTPPQRSNSYLAMIIKEVMSSAAEAELGALYLNACKAVYLQQILTEMGHPQPQTSFQTDNLTAKGVINNKIQPKQTKAMDMCFHWLCDREAQDQFRIYWWPGKTNLADYLQNILLPYTM